MSEHQHYEFLKMDGSLTQQEQSQLRQISSRAKITNRTFTNVYNYGDLKAEPQRLLAQYFDAHVYYANWGTRIFSVKIPKTALTKTHIDAFLNDDCLSCDAYDQHWVITWHSFNEDGYEDIYEEEERNWMACLHTIRDELLMGDLRSLYLGWLAGIDTDNIDEKDTEPMNMAGLSQLTPSQQELVELLRLDPDWLAAAQAGSPDQPAANPQAQKQFIKSLSEPSKQRILLDILTSSDRSASIQLQADYQAWQRQNTASTKASARYLTNILGFVGKAQEQRLAAERAEQRQAEKKAQQAKARRLQKVYESGDAAWEQVMTNAEIGSGRGYDTAASLVDELRQAYHNAGKDEEFNQQFQKIVPALKKRPALAKRLVKLKFLDA